MIFEVTIDGDVYKYELIKVDSKLRPIFTPIGDNIATGRILEQCILDCEMQWRVQVGKAARSILGF